MSKPVETPWSEQADAEGAARGDAALGAEALDNLLRILGDQISSADRQHGESMREMQTRLARIGDHTETVKSGLPQKHATAFERIEDGMAELAERFAESNRAQQAPRPEPERELSPTPPPAARAPAPSYSVPHDDALDFIPAITSKSALSTRAPAVFEDRWDRQDAEALTRHYENTRDELPPRRSAFQPAPTASRTAHTAPITTSIASDARSPGAPLSTPAPVDADWLDNRLTNIAERVEQALAVLRPDSQLLAINQRFDQFESRVTSVLDDVAARADVQGLGEVEKQIGDLSRQLDDVVGQLGRMERIEEQIGALRDKLSEEQIVRLFGNLIPTQDDLVRFAEMAATAAAERVASQAHVSSETDGSASRNSPGDDAGALTSLHALLTASIDEHKRGDASTAEALDTVHLALQQVLDRIETLETLARHPRHAEVAMPDVLTPTRVVQDQMPIPAGVLARNTNPLSAPVPTHQSVEPEFVATADREQELHLSYEPPASLSAPVAETPPMDPPPTAPIIGPDGLVAAPPRARAKAPVDRKHMIELARQAAEKARAESAAELAARSASDRKSLFAGNSAAETRGKGGVRTSILLFATIAAFLLAASFFILGPRWLPGNTSLDNPSMRAVPPTEPDAPPAKMPTIKEDPAPALKQQGTGPEPLIPQTRADAGTMVPEQSASEGGRSGNDAGRFAANAPTSAAPSASSGVVGIAVEGSERAVTALDLARARQRAHLAALSAQTAHNAARAAPVEYAAATSDQHASTPAVEPVSVPTRETTPPPSPRSEANPSVELPPPLIGPNSLRNAAANGDASAQFEVASRFAESKGVKQNFAQAAVWYQRAATRGLAQAQYRLASLYERGLGVENDPAKARVWYARAAEQGNLKAMHNLAVLSAGSDQGTPDYTAASHWFTRAAEHGLADSQYNLGVLHENGLGVTRSLIEAYKWYTLAAASGDTEAARRRELLKPRLDPAALATAVRAVAEWKPRQPNAMANDPRIAGEAWKARAQAAQ